jgi:NTP pyrophosphatase (non-canonical NTP hydrolase)
VVGATLPGMADDVDVGSGDDLLSLMEAVRHFAGARNWEQFHTPKNLVMALTGEAGELAAEFQWLTATESFGVMLDEAKRARVEDEIADVLIYLVRLADVLGVDLVAVGRRKLGRNEDRFPAPRGATDLPSGERD